MHTISGDRFEWDPAKSAANEVKHGISFASAIALWDGLTAPIASNRPGEKRFLAVGLIEGRFWTAIYTLRDGDRIRLISVRHSRPNEKALYENNLSQP